MNFFSDRIDAVPNEERRQVSAAPATSPIETITGPVDGLAGAGDDEALGFDDASDPDSVVVPSLPRRRAHHAWLLLRLALVAADIAAVALAPHFVYWFRFGGWGPRGADSISIDLASLIIVMALQVCRAYDRSAMRHPLGALQAVGLAWMGATTAVFIVGIYGQSGAGIVHPWLTPSWVVMGWFVGLIHVVMTVIVAHLMANGYLRERIVIVGADGTRSETIVRQVVGSGTNEITILGLFDDRKGRVPDHVEGYPVLGDTNSLVAYVRSNQVDRVILSLPWTAERRVLGLIEKLRQLPVRIDLLPHNLIWGFHTDIGRVAGIPVVTVANQRIDAQLGLLKRIEDIVLGSLFVLILAPIFVIIAIAVKLTSSGPVLFRQKRYGFNNEVFNVYKFRSMYDRGESAPVRQASRGDARVTPLGRFLRRTSLDELPQFFNVLEGTMSIVGPRPHAIPHNIEYGKIISGYFARHNVKPGITGWAQVNGYRGETDTTEKMTKRVEFDLYYIEHWSLTFDLKVIVMTAFRVWFQTTAY